MTQVYFTPWERSHAVRMAERGRPFDADAFKAATFLGIEEQGDEIEELQQQVGVLEGSVSSAESVAEDYMVQRDDAQEKLAAVTKKLDAIREALKEVDA